MLLMLLDRLPMNTTVDDAVGDDDAPLNTAEPSLRISIFIVTRRRCLQHQDGRAFHCTVTGVPSDEALHWRKNGRICAKAATDVPHGDATLESLPFFAIVALR
jgi:hypothetical protein